jgi:hypothetical protein
MRTSGAFNVPFEAEKRGENAGSLRRGPTAHAAMNETFSSSSGTASSCSRRSAMVEGPGLGQPQVRQPSSAHRPSHLATSLPRRSTGHLLLVPTHLELSDLRHGHPLKRSTSTRPSPTRRKIKSVSEDCRYQKTSPIVRMCTVFLSSDSNDGSGPLPKSVHLLRGHNDDIFREPHSAQRTSDLEPSLSFG